MSILSKIAEFVKAHANDIIILAVIALVALFSFACGYIMAKYQARPPIQIESRK